jgi:hypothetical protein
MQLRLIVACMLGLLALQVVAGYYYDKKSSEQIGKCSPGDADIDEKVCGKMVPTYCYDNEAWCCATCEKYANYTDGPGCKYGDKADWCAGYLKSGGTCQDENVQKYCCHSCANKLRSLSRSSDVQPKCKPGDADFVHDYCQTVSHAYCYFASEYCCATCEGLNTATAGCEYGNLADWCKKYIGDDKTKCSDQNVKNNCCEECGGAHSVKLDFAESLLRKLLANSKK